MSLQINPLCVGIQARHLVWQ